MDLPSSIDIFCPLIHRYFCVLAWSRDAHSDPGGVMVGYPRACLAGFLLTVCASVVVAPHWLSSFNWVAGGNRSGYRCLFNDASDWGQDTYRLQRWIEQHRIEAPVYVHSTISGHDELEAVGAQFESLPTSLDAVHRPCWIVLSKSNLASRPAFRSWSIRCGQKSTSVELMSRIVATDGGAIRRRRERQRRLTINHCTAWCVH